MAKPKERIKARELRKQGLSIKDISDKLNVSKSSVSLWTRDIILTIKQYESLYKKMVRLGNKGRMIGALKQKNTRLKKIEKAKRKGRLEIKKISRKSLFLIGLSLYWAEGSKKQRRLSFCNSDPYLINLMIKWLELCLKISLDRLTCYVGINERHLKREQKIKKFWSNITGIPLSQFTKTSFKKVKNIKIFKDSSSYYGILTINVRRSADLYYAIIGKIYGLARCKVV
jgi:transcriptional regulator with XRE-family HTH domain